MSDEEIKTVENKLLDLALEGDRDAAQRHSDLYLFRRNWERARSAEDWRNFVCQAQDAQACLTAN